MIIRVVSPYSLYALRHRSSYTEWMHPHSPFRLVWGLRRRDWDLAGVISSGLVGTFHPLSGTAHLFVQWAIHVTPVFARHSRERVRRSSYRTHARRKQSGKAFRCNSSGPKAFVTEPL